MSCRAITKKGLNCVNRGKYDGYCGIHNNINNTITTSITSITNQMSNMNVISNTKTFTITFGDQAENHVGMLKIGKLADKGFTYDELLLAQQYFQDKNYNTELIEMSYNNYNAHVLIARNGLNAICNPDDFYNEQDALEKDTKAFIYGRVVNKIARHNLCFDDRNVDPNYQQGIGRIIAFNDVPLLDSVRNELPNIIGDKARDLKAEGNYYYDVNKCGIGFHGDSERKIVIGIRVGCSMLLRYRWHQNNQVKSDNIDIMLNHGDIYFMSEKAVGFDWKCSSIPTLRHAAGCAKYTN